MAGWPQVPGICLCLSLSPECRDHRHAPPWPSFFIWILGITQVLMLGAELAPRIELSLLPWTSLSFPFKFIHFGFMYVGVLTAWVYAPCLCLVPTEASKRTPGPLRLVLRMGRNCREGAESWTRVLWGSSWCSSSLSSLQPLLFYFFLTVISCVYVCGWAHTCYQTHMEVRGQPRATVSLLPRVSEGQLRSSGLAPSAFTHWTILPFLNLF